MGISVSHELTVLLFSALSGSIISLIFDMLKIIRKKSSAGIFISALSDVLFWLFATIIMFFAIYFINRGKLRFYQFAGAIIGAILYFSLLSEWISAFLRHFIDIFCRIFEFFFKILLTPLKISYKLLCVSLSFVAKPVIRLLRNLACKVKHIIKKNIKTFKFYKKEK